MRKVVWKRGAIFNVCEKVVGRKGRLKTRMVFRKPPQRSLSRFR
jgi:hypothetical protein